MYALPLFVTSDTVTPEGSEVLVGPKNHSNLGEATSIGRGLGVISAEHSSMKFFPAVAVLTPAGEMNMAPISTELRVRRFTLILVVIFE